MSSSGNNRRIDPTALRRLADLEPSLRPPTTTAATGQRGPRLGYRPALDGVRALAVLAVVAYHAGADWLPGGFLGVEVFFVVSGFLITTLLREEFEGTGRIDLRQFWTRRIRRLMPALYLTIAVVCLYALSRAPDAVQHLKGDTVAALLYVTNWYAIFTQQSYFDALGRPPLLRHLWSLAIEEQWYLIWPIAFGVLLRGARGRVRRLGPILALAAVASSLAMAVMFDPDRDPSRVYYGTDTRASGLLLGAALACLYQPWRSRRRGPAAERRAAIVDVLGVLGLVGLAAAIWRFDEISPTVYRGGFLAVAVLTCAVIAAAVHPLSRVMTAALSWRPLVVIGTRSYGLYLWHWPVLMLTRPQDVDLGPTARLALQIVVTVVLTEASFRLVERPVRSGAIGRWWAAHRAAGPGAPSLLATPVGIGILVVGTTIVVAGADLASTVPPDPLAGPEAAEFVLADFIQTPTSMPVATTAAPSLPSDTSATAPGAPTITAPVAPTLAPPTTLPTLPRRIVVVGDSVGKTLVRNAPEELGPTLTITSGAIEGCGVVDGKIATAARWRVSFDNCGDIPTRWSEAAREGSAEVVVVTVGAWEVFDLRRDAGDLTFGSAEWVTYFTARFDAAIDALVATGAHVALLEVPCFRPVDGGGLVALPERGDDTRTALLNDLLRQRADSDPAHVTFVAGPVEFCADETAATDLNLRWDGVHYYRPGAALVWSTITPTLLQLPTGQ